MSLLKLNDPLRVDMNDGTGFDVAPSDSIELDPAGVVFEHEGEVLFLPWSTVKLIRQPVVRRT